MSLSETVVEQIESKIYLIRGQKVMLDVDLATLYQVTTFNLNKAVKRNRVRFPDDFMFQLNHGEAEPLKFQIGMSKKTGRGGRRTLPFAFTQEGIAMLSSVLRSEQAILVNIRIMRVFVQMRSILISTKDLEMKLLELEAKSDRHDGELLVVFDAIKKLMSTKSIPRKRIIGLGNEDV